jgi:hypothetical protein
MLIRTRGKIPAPFGGPPGQKWGARALEVRMLDEL